MGHVLMRLGCDSRDGLWLSDRKANSKAGPGSTLEKQGLRLEAWLAAERLGKDWHGGA